MKDKVSSNDITPVLQDNSPTFICQLMSYIETVDIDKFKEKLIERPLPQKTKNNLLKKALIRYSQTPKVKEIIESLLANGADPNINIRFNIKDKDLPDIYPLMYIVETNDLNLLKIFLRYGALPNSKDSNNRNCLFYLFKSQCENKIPMAKEVLHSSININDTDSNGLTVLMEAVIRGMKDLVEVFLEYKADVNCQNSKDGNTAMHYAVKLKNKEMIQVLLNNKPGLHIKNKNNDTPLDLATKMTSQTEIYSILAEYYSFESANNIDDNSSSNSSSIQSNTIHSNTNSNTKGKKFNFNDCIFKQKLDYVYSRIEIPFNFQEKASNSTNYNSFDNYNSNYLPNNNTSSNFDNNTSNNSESTYSNGNIANGTNSNQLHSFIKIIHTPTLYIDISDEESQEKLILDGLKTENINNGIKIKNNESTLQSTSLENEKLKAELKSLKEQIQLKDQSVKLLNDQTKQQEHDNVIEYNMLQNKMEEKNQSIQVLLDQCEHLRGQAHHNRITGISHYLDNKFSSLHFDEMFITKNITKDILDFLHLTKIENEQKERFIMKTISSFEELIISLHFDYQIKICGSFATGTNLIWSALDLVLVPTSNQQTKEYSVLQTLYIKLQELNWVISTNIIDSNIIPAVTFTTNDLYGNLTVNVSIQDMKYNCLLCVELTKYYISTYPTLEPLVISLKQILKNSNLLTYPGGLNSYALMLMIVFFFQVQLADIAPIDTSDYSNLGRLFREFSKFYGMRFDPSNSLIFIRSVKKETLDPETMNYITKHPTDLIIVDPLNNLNNVSEGTFHYENVKLAFMIGYAISKDNCECSCHYLTESNDLGYKNIEHCILKKIFNTAKRLNSITN